MKYIYILTYQYVAPFPGSSPAFQLYHVAENLEGAFEWGYIYQLLLRSLNYGG